MGPIQRGEPLVNQVYRYLRDGILTGEFPAGEKIVETRLAMNLKVSRSPVREAIRLLIMEQLLVEKDGDIRVFEPTLKDYFELYDLRLALEPVVARQAAERRMVEHLAPLLRNLAETESCLKEMNVKRLIFLNSEFHQLVRGLSGNARLTRILDSVSPVIEYYGRLVLNINNNKTNILEEHTAIYLAVERGDGNTAERVMYDHIIKDLEVVQLRTKDTQRMDTCFEVESVASETQDS
ncbi:MAG: GntR family transcriptional regulator [Alicyclobacillus herbarius]|uniref:GntR family transcriptional regulator n=1 Tax=Alicyclobacillus herbarius TaxID=122960 RepID=UPI0003F5F39C|nr:GntR family transcriptional regulator [Alicyclobacillus herbarius]MCL6632629.1 GntR family transcriptional regulator [Alicyclobacillus herbarius]